MSYLHPLRLHFAGRFQANVSTVNNDPGHFDNASFQSGYQQLQGPRMNPPNGWFNPQGDAAWRFLGCTVTAAWLPSGAVPTSDPVLQCIVADADDRAPAKLVDLDSEQQLVSEIWGLQVRIADARGNTLLRGEFAPAAFLDIWDRATGAGSGGDQIAGAMYQSVLTDLQWGDVSASPFLRALKDAAADGLLSIKFNVDGFNMNFNSPDFMCGRVNGTIGPATAAEPQHLVLGRQFMTESASPPGNFFAPAGGINFFPAVVDHAAGCIWLDLGNALSTGTPGGPPNDLGDLVLSVASPGNPSGIPLGTIPSRGSGGYASDPTWTDRTAGVVALPLSSAQLQAVATAPLTLSGKPSIGISEWSSGAFVRADTYVYRVSPGDAPAISVYATQWGRPLVGARVDFAADPSQLQPPPAAPPYFPYVAAGTPVAVPAEAVGFDTAPPTDGQGRTVLTLRTSDPGTPRYFNNGQDYGLDGQVYGIRPALSDPQYSGPVNPWNFISVLLWSGFTPSKPVTWDDVQPIFQQYANLYPVMNRFLNMADYRSVVANASLLQMAFGLGPSNPNAMPVTRDLSPAKRSAILTWLANPLPGTRVARAPAEASAEAKAAALVDASPGAGAGPGAAGRGGKAAAAARRLGLQLARAQLAAPPQSKGRVLLQRSLIRGLQDQAPLKAVLASLQQAVKLEHATIPVYLYALYSIDASKNPEIAAIIQSVVVEEMLHMTLAANVLNALGGTPEIDQPGFVPTYPGPLPGGVESGLIVNLAPFSMEQLQTFLDIEMPEDPINYRVALTAELAAEPITIGQFYTAISDAIAQLGDGAFVKPPRNQVGPDLMPESVVVMDVASAQRAIQIIIEQGEGTSTSPREVTGGGYAHYYRFMQIQKGRLLVPVSPKLPPDEQYAYRGAPVPFRPDGVYAVRTNPKSSDYPPGSIQAFANDNFNYTYTGLLQALYALFNGRATQDQLDTTIGLMMSLKGQAKAMMSGIPDASVLTGPSFEYQPVNP